MNHDAIRTFVRQAAGSARGISRRGSLRLLGGAALSGALGRSVPDAGACRRKGRQCGGKKGTCCGKLRCCDGRCRAVNSDPDYCGGCRTACDAAEGQSCEGGGCACADGRPPCGARCCEPQCSCIGNGLCQCPVVG